MKNNDCILSPQSRKKLGTQGYLGFSDAELNEFKFGFRFAYYLCSSIVILGLIFSSIKILAVAMIIAALGTLPPFHPFDYLYNYVIRHFLGKSKIPPRTNQGRFACLMATVWVGGIIFLFYSGLFIWGYIFGGILVIIAGLVSIFDFCIPSMIYNFLFKVK